jgi:mRNA interferase MazF
MLSHSDTFAHWRLLVSRGLKLFEKRYESPPSSWLVVNRFGVRQKSSPPISKIDKRCKKLLRLWRAFVSRGDVVRLLPSSRPGHEQQGPRFAIVIQSDVLAPLSTVLVAPTSQSALAATFRPEVTIKSESTRVLLEQMTAVDIRRTSDAIGRLGVEEMWAVDEALALVVGLHL